MENFVVSARKYRPATFASVVGQKHITSTLKNAIERGQLAHAYLFCGPRGVGKTTCARIFAKAINCLEPAGAEACNRCESCRSFNENRSLNIHELDAASNNSVDDIRALIEQVRILPQSGRYSVFIIDEVHMLSSAAFNAFLKTLEEPPAHAVFILATTEKHKILPTILSRCQIYDFNRIRVEDAVEYLRYIASQEGVAADDESLNLIAQKADGGMRDALSMFDKAVSFCGRELRYQEVAQTLNVLDYDTYFQITERLLAGDYVQTLLMFDEVLSRGFAGQTFLAGLNRHLRDLLVAKDPQTLRLIEMTGTLLERYRMQAEACDVGFLFGAISILTELDSKIRQSSDQRLLVELGLMKIAGLGQKKNNPDGPFVERAYPLPELAADAAAQAGAASAAGSAGAAVSAGPVGSVGAGVAGSAGTAGAAAPSAGSVPAASAVVRDAVPAVSQKPAPASPRAASAAAERPAQAEEPSAAASAAPASRSAEAPTVGAAPVSAPRPQSAPRMGRTPLVSLSELMNDREPAVEETPAAQQPREADDRCERKLEEHRAELLESIREMRPRFAAVFEQMRFSGNRVEISVPTAELREEILRSKTELLTRMMEVASLAGALQLDITVNEQMRASTPIRLEDRLAWLSERNASLQKLRKALDLEVEG